MTRKPMIAAAIGLSAVAAALPSSADAAVKWRCSATPLAGTLLGQQLPTPTAGSNTGECRDDATLPTLSLPDPLSSLLSVDLANGTTSVNESGAFAGAGLAQVKVGSLPIPIPNIPIPDDLKNIKVKVPDHGDDPVASVDLSPAIAAIQSLPSKSLLNAGVLYSNVAGTCQDGRPVLNGESRVLNADILGLTVDTSKTVDSAINLVDTSNIALSSLDTSLAHITLLGNSADVSTGQILDALAPMLKDLPPLAIPEQIGHLKLTASSQTMEDGMLVQRALRAQISLLGTSIADLTVGQAAVGAGAACTPPAPKLALECTKRKLALIDVLPEGNHVRLYGAADHSLAGKTVSIVFKATHTVVAKVKVADDGSFTTTAPLPPLDIRATNRARYIAKAGGEKSLNLKLMRRMFVRSIRSHGNKVTIKGQVVAPLAVTPQTITLKRRVTCHRLEVVKRFKPRSDGSFTVTVKKPKNLAATVYRLQTQVRQSYTNPKLYPTFTLPRAVDL